MGHRIIADENVSLRRSCQDPTGEQGFARGGWFLDICSTGSRSMGRTRVSTQAVAAEALLLGRRTDEFFGPRGCPVRVRGPDRLNSMPRYAASSTVQAAEAGATRRSCGAMWWTRSPL